MLRSSSSLELASPRGGSSSSMPPKKSPITAEGLRLFFDDPMEGVRVIRNSNGIYQADWKSFCWQPSFYGGSSGAADDDHETVSVGGCARSSKVR